MTSDITAVFVYPATVRYLNTFIGVFFNLFSHSKAQILHFQGLKHIIASPFWWFKLITFAVATAKVEVRGSKLKFSLNYSELKTRRLNLARFCLKWELEVLE